MKIHFTRWVESVSALLMKTNSTLGARKPKLPNTVCSVRNSWFVPVVLAIMTIFSFSNFATAQASKLEAISQTATTQAQPVIIVIQGEYPGPDVVPTEVASLGLAKVNGSTAPTIENCPADQTAECFSDVGHLMTVSVVSIMHVFILNEKTNSYRGLSR